MNDLERRYSSGLEVRQSDGGIKLQGLAVSYDTLSEDMGFRERIASGAFSRNLRSDPDVRALVEHRAEKIIGRSRAGTLQLTEGDVGVEVTIDPPDTQVGHDVVESVKRGDLTGMSFGFRAINDTWSTENGESVRTVTEAELVDVSIVAYPAYPDTSVAVRSLNAWRSKKEERNMTEPKNEPAPATTVVEPTEPKPEPAPERRTAPPATPAVHGENVDPLAWRDHATGREIRVLGRNEKFTDLYRSNEPLSLGRAIRAIAIGDWSGAEAEQRAMSTSVNTAGGMMVPNPLAANVIDLARARSALLRAGAETVPMDASTLTIARLTGDATMEVKSENATFSGSDASFDAVTLTATTIGTVVKMSRELAADAPNAVQVIENSLAAKLAERIDFYGLRGTGSQQPLGLLSMSGLNTVAVGGSVTWDDVLSGIRENEIDNHTSNAFVMSPTNADVLRKLKNNSEVNNYSSPPPIVQTMLALSTSNMPDSTMLVADFTKYMIGLRQSPTIEVSTDAGFAEHQLQIKVTWRGDFAPADKTAFCTLTGIA